MFGIKAALTSAFCHDDSIIFPQTSVHSHCQQIPSVINTFDQIQGGKEGGKKGIGVKFNPFFPIHVLQCSASCGRGFRSRTVSCVAASGLVIAEENCQGLSPKPSRQRRCRGGRCPKWKTGSWGEVGKSLEHQASPPLINTVFTVITLLIVLVGMETPRNSGAGCRQLL